MIIKHPTLPGVTRDVSEAAVARWVEAGWEATEILAWTGQHVATVLEAPPCPTCGAVGDDPCVTFHTNEPTRRHAARAAASVAEVPLGPADELQPHSEDD